MRIRIEKGAASGEVTAPPSKSMAHRLLIAATLADGESTVRGISHCEDVLATADCLTALGARIVLCGGDARVTEGVKWAEPTSPLFCRESGSTLRFLLPIAMLSGRKTVFEGAEGLMRRPMTVYEDIAREKGLGYQREGNRITVCGPIRGGIYTIPGNISSQFVSGLLFALPLAEEDSILHLTTDVESRSYINMTVEALRAFGIFVAWADAKTLKIPGGQVYTAADVSVEGDASGAAFPEALNLFGGRVRVGGLNPESLQGDAVYHTLFSELASHAATVSIADCPDLAPILFAVAAAKHGGTFLDTGRLRIKESDRASAMAEELEKFGARVTVYDNSVVIEPLAFHKPSSMLWGHRDHRIVMALSVLCTLTGGEIDGAEAINKSYPDFFEHLKQLGIEVNEL